MRAVVNLKNDSGGNPGSGDDIDIDLSRGVTDGIRATLGRECAYEQECPGHHLVMVSF